MSGLDRTLNAPTHAVNAPPRLSGPSRENGSPRARRGAGGSASRARPSPRDSARALFATALALQALVFSPVTCANDQETPWQFSLTPYLWLPRVEASLRFETPGSGG